MYNAPSPQNKKRSAGKGKRQAEQRDVETATMEANGAEEASSQNAEEPSEQAQLKLWVAVLTLVISTAFVGICAEFMTSAINEISPPDGSGKLSRTFVGLILLPIVGNAAEHATAVTMAIKDKMDLAIGVAIGSSMQIALLVIPFVVVLGWMLGNSNMNLAFDGFQITTLFVAVLLISYLIQDGKSNWSVPLSVRCFAHRFNEFFQARRCNLDSIVSDYRYSRLVRYPAKLDLSSLTFNRYYPSNTTSRK